MGMGIENPVGDDPFYNPAIVNMNFSISTLKLVKRLVWNSLGTLLAVQYESHVEFWRQGNYHWYRQLSIKAKKA